MIDNITERQRTVLRYVDRSIRERGYPPTLREVCVELGTASTNSASDHIRHLVRKGCLEKDRAKSRGTRLTFRGLAAIGVLSPPVIGPLLIVLEGADGSGKTAQTARLHTTIREAHDRAILTAEPTHEGPGAWIRRILAGREPAPPALELASLYARDRLAHVARVILPAFAREEHVICDRYILSSIVYQHGILGLDLGHVRSLSRHAPRPDLTIVLDVDAETAAKRRAARGGAAELFDAPEKQARIVDLYRRAAEWLPGERVAIVDGSGDEETVASRVWGEVKRVMGGAEK